MDPTAKLRFLWKRCTSAALLPVVVGCATAVPTGTPGVSTIGRDTVLYEGPELIMSLDTRLARQTVGSD